MPRSGRHMVKQGKRIKQDGLRPAFALMGDQDAMAASGHYVLGGAANERYSLAIVTSLVRPAANGDPRHQKTVSVMMMKVSIYCLRNPTWNWKPT